MSWCWLTGHSWERDGTNFLGYPRYFCRRCLDVRVVSSPPRRRELPRGRTSPIWLRR